MKTKENSSKTLVSLIVWKIYFDKVIKVVQLLVQSDG